jgi:hypothetical protein
VESARWGARQCLTRTRHTSTLISNILVVFLTLYSISLPLLRRVENLDFGARSTVKKTSVSSKSRRLNDQLSCLCELDRVSLPFASAWIASRCRDIRQEEPLAMVQRSTFWELKSDWSDRPIPSLSVPDLLRNGRYSLLDQQSPAFFGNIMNRIHF